MSVELDINGINNLSGLLGRLPLGEQTRALLQRLGSWNTRAHEGAAARIKPLPAAFSELNDDALSDTFAHWNSQLMCAIELAGLLDGQRKFLELQAKKARASARSKIRDDYETKVENAETGVKIPKPTAGEINDRAEDDAEVTDADTALVMLDIVLAGVHANKEACFTAVQGISREISFRQAQFTARIRS